MGKMAKILSIFSFLILSVQTWANPFQSTFETANEDNEIFYQQTPPFKYPFTQDDSLNNLEVNLDKMGKLLGQNKLGKLESIYKIFPYNKKVGLYSYPFSVGSKWDILPYPWIKSMDKIKADEWVPHFQASTKETPIHNLEFLKKMNEITQSTLYAGNKIELLKNPYNTNKMMEKLSQAKHHVFMTSFLFQCDAGTKSLRNLIRKKIKEGLQYYLIIDKTFVRADKACAKELKEMGVHLGLQGQAGNIFHEKMYVFDGEYAMIDGQNLIGPQVLSNGHNNLLNDTAAGLTGPMVQEIAHHFFNHWKKIKQEMPSDIIEFYHQLKLKAASMATNEAIEEGLEKRQGLCRLVVDKPQGKKRHIYPMYQAYVDQAQHYIFFNQIDMRFEFMLQNKQGNEFIENLIAKANANKDLRIDMLANHWKLPTDIALPEGQGVPPTFLSWMMTKPGSLFIDRPHKQIEKGRKQFSPKMNGADFHWWTSSIYNHSKTMMVDNIAVMVGSFNINVASITASYEQTLVCHDEELSKQTQKSIVQDLLNSIPIFFIQN